MTKLPPKDPAERKLARFIFTADLSSGETVVSAAVAIELLDGTDAVPGLVLDGAPLVDSATNDVLQWLTGGVRDADYGLRCLATASGGAVHLASARLPVRRM